jgi:preprotein translocase subunit SecA
VKDSGGLHILGTERHESRRIDNQLRGRAGRQGDPGSTRFFLSLEDSLMRIFASDRMRGIMQALGMSKGEAIEHKMVTNAIEKAQRKVEGRNFDIRKSLLEYDDVANDQRTVIYEQRNDVMEAEDIADIIEAIREEVVNEVINDYIPPQSLDEQWNIEGLQKVLEREFAVQLPVQQWLDDDNQLHEESLRQRIVEAVEAQYKSKEASVSAEAMRGFEKQVFLQILDTLWKEHLAGMDHLRQGIHLRSYAQKNPKQEYKRESFELFQGMLHKLKMDVVRVISHVKIQSQEEASAVERRRREELELQMGAARSEHAESAGMSDTGEIDTDGGLKQEPMTRDGRKVGRNEVCPCGSGKKFKQCHGRIAS